MTRLSFNACFSFSSSLAFFIRACISGRSHRILSSFSCMSNSYEQLNITHCATWSCSLLSLKSSSSVCEICCILFLLLVMFSLDFLTCLNLGVVCLCRHLVNYLEQGRALKNTSIISCITPRPRLQLQHECQVHTLSDLGMSSNLTGSLSLANEHYSLSSEWIMSDPNKNKMAGMNMWFANISESEILRMQDA